MKTEAERLREIATKTALTLLALSLNCTALAGAAEPVGNASALKLKSLPHSAKKNSTAPPNRADTLLVMPNRTADYSEALDALKEVHGTIVDSFGEGEMKCLIIKTERGMLKQTEKKLKSDKHFAVVQRDFMAPAQVMSASQVNDPYFPGQWHMAALRATHAWQYSTGSGVIVAVGDSGSQASNADLSGKTYQGYNAVKNTQGGNYDYHFGGSHGTTVATAAAAKTGNGSLTASPACNSLIYPIVVSEANGNGMYTSEIYLARAIYNAGMNGIRILNISYGMSDTNYSYANPQIHPVLHQYLKWYHDQRNGLAFFSAGNDSSFDPHQRLPYMIMVSAIDQSYNLSNFSNYGNSLWFTAPGSNIYCSDRNGQIQSVYGTSFSCPLVASIAALVLGRNPNLTNTQVENILVRSCVNAPGSTWNQQYGFGMPQADTAVLLAGN
ncbi:MAG: S8 family serine peptidase [Candidatus Melainabacteria bacterium]|nr:S8 family serine peptidase [Candidatus Melainabacteria bacterium]